MRGWPVAVAAVVVLAMIALGAVNAIRVARQGDPVLPAPQEVSAPVEGSLSLEQAAAAAATEAQRWRPGAAMVFASLQADWPLDDEEADPGAVPPGGWARFAYIDSVSAPTAILSVEVERYSGAVVNASEQPWSALGQHPLILNALPVSSLRALVIAEVAAGQSWRLGCPVDRHETDVTLVSASSDPAAAAPTGLPVATPTTGESTPPATPVADGAEPASDPAFEPVWLVTYRDGRDGGVNALSIEVDAADGTVRSIRDQSEPCDNA